MKHNRRGFLRMLLAAPIAAVTAAGLWKPETSWARYQRLGVYKRYMGTMRITREAMEQIQPRSGAFEEALQRHINEHRSILMDDMNRQFGVRG